MRHTGILGAYCQFLLYIQVIQKMSAHSLSHKRLIDPNSATIKAFHLKRVCVITQLAD